MPNMMPDAMPGNSANLPPAAPAPGGDAVKILDQIIDLLGQLRDSLAPAAPEAPPEFEPQTDDEVVAGMKPRPKAPSGLPAA